MHTPGHQLDGPRDGGGDRLLSHTLKALSFGLRPGDD
jgi:hypothetical protein